MKIGDEVEIKRNSPGSRYPHRKIYITNFAPRGMVELQNDKGTKLESRRMDELRKVGITQ